MKFILNTPPVRFQMPDGRVDVTPNVRIMFGPGLRPRDPRYVNPNDRCFAVAVTTDRGRHWRKFWLGRKLWRIDHIDSKGTY